MASETDLCNDALSQLGALTITGIDDGSINANHCLRFYPTLRDGLIRAYKWNFALKRVQLAQDATAPPFEFAYAYTLPPDCLRLWEYNGADTFTNSGADWLTLMLVSKSERYKVEQGKILTNDAQVDIVYAQRITNPDLWNPMFYQMLATWLASKLALAITKDEKKSMALLQTAETVLLPLALAADGQESSVDPFSVDDLLWGRGIA